MRLADKLTEKNLRNHDRVDQPNRCCAGNFRAVARYFVVMSESHPTNPKLPRCPLCQSGHTIQTSEHFGELMFFCLDCEHSWTVQPGRLPPRPRIGVVSASSDDRRLPLRAPGLRLARTPARVLARAAAARAASMRLAVEFEARRDVFLYLRSLIERARAITEAVH
jgi:hypothetical protein